MSSGGGGVHYLCPQVFIALTLLDGDNGHFLNPMQSTPHIQLFLSSSTQSAASKSFLNGNSGAATAIAPLRPAFPLP